MQLQAKGVLFHRSKAYRLYENRACNFQVTAQYSQQNSDKCVGRAKWKPFSSPVNATLVLVGVVFLA